MKQKFEEVYSTYKNSIYGYLYYMTKDKEIAEDLCQETFLKIYLNLRKFKGECSIKTWCMIIARNTFFTWSRKKKVDYVELKEELMLSSSKVNKPEEEVILQEKGKLIKDILFMIKEEYRNMIILRDYEGLTYKEIAMITGSSDTKIKVDIYRARNEYKKLYEKLGGSKYEM